MTVELSWRRSTYSNGNDMCVEVAVGSDGSVHVRDSKDLGNGPELVFTSAEWRAFLAGAQDGEFSP